MPHPVTGVDHTYLLVHDLDASAERYRRLGFTLSPRGLHSTQKGTANHTIVFADDYFELLGVVRETELNAPQRKSLGDFGEGLKAIANRTSDADAAKPALAEIGIETGDVSAFSRPLPLEDGREGIASFRTLGFAPSAVPIGHFFLCQHETPDMVWRPELQHHENGVTALAGIVGIDESPRAIAETYARFYAAGRVVEAEGGYRVETGNSSSPLLFVDEAAAKALFPGIGRPAAPTDGFTALRLRVLDIENVKAHLAGQGIPYAPTPGGGIAVAPVAASGAIIEFVTE